MLEFEIWAIFHSVSKFALFLPCWHIFCILCLHCVPFLVRKGFRLTDSYFSCFKYAWYVPFDIIEVYTSHYELVFYSMVFERTLYLSQICIVTLCAFPLHFLAFPLPIAFLLWFLFGALCNVFYICIYVNSFSFIGIFSLSILYYSCSVI